MLRETNPLWAPIEPFWQSAGQIIDAYEQAAPRVRVCRTGRYSLVLTEPRPEPSEGTAQ